MFCLKVVKPIKLRAGGENYVLPVGRCLHVLCSVGAAYTVVHDETDEHFNILKNSLNVVIATAEDMANEPVD